MQVTAYQMHILHTNVTEVSVLVRHS